MSAARNDGIEKASGEYLFCVDGDDYIDEDFFEKFYNNAKKNDSDLVVLSSFWNLDKRINNNSFDFNPLLGSKNIVKKTIPSSIIKYQSLVEKCRSRKDIEDLKARALNEGVIIKDNSYFISQAERQCVNARIQGGAATMSKKAMIKVYNDSILKELGFKLLLAVHDELIGECPIENKDEVADRLTLLMRESALPEVVTPFKCDATIENVWYETEYSTKLKAEHVKNLKNSMSEEQSFNELAETHSECSIEQIKSFLQ